MPHLFSDEQPCTVVSFGDDGSDNVGCHSCLDKYSWPNEGHTSRAAGNESPDGDGYKHNVGSGVYDGPRI